MTPGEYRKTSSLYSSAKTNICSVSGDKYLRDLQAKIDLQMAFLQVAELSKNAPYCFYSRIVQGRTQKKRGQRRKTTAGLYQQRWGLQKGKQFFFLEPTSLFQGICISDLLSAVCAISDVISWCSPIFETLHLQLLLYIGVPVIEEADDRRACCLSFDLV